MTYQLAAKFDFYYDITDSLNDDMTNIFNVYVSTGRNIMEMHLSDYAYVESKHYFAAMTAGSLCDVLGCRVVLIIGTTFSITGFCTIFFAPNLNWIFFGLGTLHGKAQRYC